MKNQVLTITVQLRYSESNFWWNRDAMMLFDTSIKAKTDPPRKIAAMHADFWKHPIGYFETHFSPFRYRRTNTCNPLYIWRMTGRWKRSPNFRSFPVALDARNCQTNSLFISHAKMQHVRQSRISPSRPELLRYLPKLYAAALSLNVNHVGRYKMYHRKMQTINRKLRFSVRILHNAERRTTMRTNFP